MFDYSEQKVADPLSDFVRCIWSFRSNVNPAPQPIAPDGCCELIVHLGTPYWERQGERETEQPLILFAGQITEPLTLIARGDVHVLGLRLQPWATRAFAGVDAGKATDRRIALNELHGDAAGPLQARLLRATSAPERIAAMEAYAQQRLAHAAVDVEVRAAVEALMAQEAPVRPADISERQWQRRFKREVGVSMRELQSVFRFRRVVDSVEQPGPPGWVEAALAAGYFDQPQMARDFRRYLGISSRQWAAQCAGLARAMAAPETYKREGRSET